MFSDFHTHSNFSGDSETPVTQQIEHAIQLGMEEICITDHHDYGVLIDGKSFTLDIPAYLSALEQVKQRYADKILVSIGIELGIQIDLKDCLEQLTNTFSFDFVIGSSHFIDGLDPFYPTFFDGRSEKEAYQRYFEVTLDRVRKLDCFDVFGHLDYVVRYGPNQNQYYNYLSYQDYIDPILRTLIQKGKGLECNTGGFKYDLGHPNPCEDILIRYRELGGEILTVGSDAHAPEHLGYSFPQLKEILLQCGFRYYTVFHNRIPEFVKI